MLRLTKVLSLKGDVLAKAPKNNMNETPRMTLIGKEREGLLLLSRDGRDTAGTPHTFIDSYDPKSRELRTLYTHPTPVIITGASISEDRALLIFTVKVSDPHDPLNTHSVVGGTDGVHSSHIVELSPIGKTYSMDISLGFHKICFVYGIGERGSSYAIVILPDEVIMVQITTKMEAGYVAISKKEKKRTSLNKRHVWYQFDMTRSILYLLSPKSAKSVTDEYVLKCFQFAHHKYNTFYEIPLFISLPPPLSPALGLSSSSSNPSRIESNFPYPYVIGGLLPVVQPHITLVRLSGNGQCLCIQREVDSVCTIRVTIYFLHLKMRLDYAIPMTNLEGGWSEYSKLRLVFDSIGNLLLVYLPGHFLQLLDCGEDHAPCLSLTMCGKEMATAIPDSQESTSTHTPPLFSNFSPLSPHTSKSGNLSMSHSTPSISLSHPNITTISQSAHNINMMSSSSRNIPILDSPPSSVTSSPVNIIPTTKVAFHLTRHETSSNNGTLGGICHSLLDCGSGNIYEYTFDREAILKLFEQDSVRVHVQALHLACIHMQDTELVDQIMIHIFSHNPQCVGVDLLKEFLICTPYFVMKQNGVEPHLLQLLPITTQDYLDAAQLKRFALQQVSITNLTGYSMVPGTKLLIRDRDKDDDLRKKRFPPEKAWNSSRGAFAPYASPTRDTYSSPLAVSRFFRSVLGFDDDVKTTPPRPVESRREDLFSGYYSSPQSPVRNYSNASSYQNVSTPNNNINNIVNNNSSTPLDIPGPGRQGDSENYLSEWEVESGDCCTPHTGQFVECLTDYWMSAFPKESKSKCANHALMYRSAQVQQINRLFSHMVTSCKSAHSEDMSLFQLMEKLYCACEDLAVPFPKDFHSLFAQLGLKCLSRPVFLQYVERGIFTFTQSFIRDLLNMPVNAPEDQNFQNQMILKLKYQSKITELLQQSSANINFLLEHFLSSITAQCLDVTDNMHLTHGPPDLEKYSSSSFLPLSILLDFINTIYSTCLIPPPNSPLSNTPPLMSSLPNFINNPKLEFVNINAFNVVRTAFSKPLDIE
eukprot:TRINITY_DN6334_c0_g2_i1.p1 TRINITY_DN6334_c0_g2~~TRINITY_DN6334_c0_g2_i1.p1  ORF type:complete len:1040 (-),score=189.52 TRINITY_DN6334_c0_g2_i1:92-3211(-)